jgi:hypothetical protein
MPRRFFFLFVPFLLCWLSAASADQSKGSRGPDGGSRAAASGIQSDPGRKQPDSSQARRDVLREAVKSQEDDAAPPLRQLTAEEKALLRQQLRQQRMGESK